MNMKVFLWLTTGIVAGLFGLRGIVFIIAERAPDFVAVAELAGAFSVLVYCCAEAAGCLRTAQEKKASQPPWPGSRRTDIVIGPQPAPQVPSIGYTANR